MLRKATGGICAALILTCTSLCPPSAHAIGDLVDVQVIDRNTGETLTPILHKGNGGSPDGRAIGMRSFSPIATPDAR